MYVRSTIINTVNSNAYCTVRIKKSHRIKDCHTENSNPKHRILEHFSLNTCKMQRPREWGTNQSPSSPYPGTNGVCTRNSYGKETDGIVLTSQIYSSLNCSSVEIPLQYITVEKNLFYLYYVQLRISPFCFLPGYLLNVIQSLEILEQRRRHNQLPP